MINNNNYYNSNVIRNVFIFVISIIGIYLSFKLAVFYFPFLIAFIIYLIFEPIIKFLMKRFKIKRKIGCIIVLSIVLVIIIGLLILSISSLISEIYKLLSNFNQYYSLISNKIQIITQYIDLSRINLPEEIVNTINNSTFSFLETITQWIRDVLTNILVFISTLPSIMIYTIITVLSLFFIITDKIYILDLLEHHLPKTWVKKLSRFIKQVSGSIFSYIKAQMLLVLISFIICLIGLIVLKIIGCNIEFPLLSATGIAFVDALPIFGSATAMIPWAVIVAINGDIKLAIGLVILLGIMLFTRQMLEPKIVSNKLGIHPLFTLIAMYTGFRFIGVIGLLIGPIVLIILKTIFSTNIDKGLIKSFFNKE